MKVDLFDFDLPPERIADRPAEPREAARLLHVAGAGLHDRRVGGLPGMLEPGDLLVFNDTRVIPARLAGHRDAAAVEVTLHKQLDGGRWRVFARPARKLRRGDRFVVADELTATVTARGAGGEVELAFDRQGADLLAALERHGHMPLPPYIKRDDDHHDRTDYQTVFATRDGAVAAPTAGLHFTPGLLNALRDRGVDSAFVTLHVGAGTFLPVKSEEAEDHPMHSEWGEITPEAAAAVAACRARGGRVVAVGTTSLRLLESAAGADGTVAPFRGETAIYILPGYRFRAVDRLWTNFHLPRSTLFMLVCAFAGRERMQAAYAHAVAAGYRFYSYGDACLLEPAP